MIDTPLTVAVLMGGPDGEHDVSLASGGSVSEALRQIESNQVIEHIIPRDGQLELDRLQADVIFPVLHGPWGEGGELQRLLEQDGRPFVGCGALAATAAMNKHHTKEVASTLGIPTPQWEHLEAGRQSTLQPPVVVKPLAEGSSLDLHVAKTSLQRDEAVSKLTLDGRDVLVETYIEGRELTVGILGDSTLPIIEIKAATGLYDYEAKYQRNDTNYVIDPPLDAATKDMMESAALALHRGLGARHLSRVDFLLDDAGPWLLEINTMPGFTSHSLLPKAAAAAGWTLPQLCQKLVDMAIAEPESSMLKGSGPGSR